MTVDLFIPCFIDQLFPKTGWNIVKTLEKAGVTVVYNPEQTCCGQPMFNSGYWPQSRKMAEKFIKDFPNERPIIIPSASCAGFMKTHYLKIFNGDDDFQKEIDRINRNTFEFTDYLVNHLKVTDFGASFPHKVTWHDGCSALREYGIKQEPRKLLSMVKGLELIEMEETDTCCGFGGTFMVKFLAVSTAMVEQKVQHALKTGAEYIVSTETSCFININSYIEMHKLPLKTMHIADLISCF
jgi:L-lactate dehydrogenase complex protein LldE